MNFLLVMIRSEHAKELINVWIWKLKKVMICVCNTVVGGINGIYLVQLVPDN